MLLITSNHLNFVKLLLSVTTLGCCLYITSAYEIGSCNEAVCASIVSKCMLTQSCKCDAKNITCSKDCFYCLDFLYSECCSCVELCPKKNDTDNYLNMKSHVEDLPEPFPDLFSVLTEEKDSRLRWISYTYPVEISFITLDKEIKFQAKSTESSNGVDAVEPSINCTVAFMSQCMSWNKCKNACSSMGASSYRWFHDGCCECVGSTCINYGINENRCLDCPLDKDQMTVEELNVISKDSVKMEDELTEETDKSSVESKNEEDFDEIQNVDS
ncbi:twisted gastrulation protein homolog 1 isoform X1 [Parasteatoda tepidariorum]|uniref:twisted gastrulation protein homolog 1 isoform X1 n=2 Tax=Parasteatoda tepidariorum TaxID=114398 RepID=UPI001C71EA75|nr:twisted gastrulation protein homolog 1 isoform X1 [Parasteatoda tepidariorum]